MQFKDTGGGEFEQPEAGSYAATCYRIIDIGTQRGEYMGVANEQHKCIIGFELDELMSTGEHAGKPFVVGKFYTVSLSEKANLRRDLEGWRGRAFTDEELNGFDSKNLLGKPCMLSIVKTDKGKTKIASISKMPKGMTAPALVNEQQYFSLQNFDQAVFDSLSDGIKKLIVQSPEYQSCLNKPKVNPPSGGGTFDELVGDLSDVCPF